ncbi:MAG: Gfo/Idh/MocA family oxidoreductase [Planctomycetaceae bacterium]|nr:Gfo/Idh/MocA family oxidoreductase [Planctomycetaceae bacterium]
MISTKRSASGFLAAMMLASWISTAWSFGKLDEEKAKKAAPIPRTALLSGFPEWVTSVAISPDGKTIAGGSYQEVRLFDAASKKETARLATGKGYVRAIAFSRDGRQLAVAGFRTVNLWGVESKKVEKSLEGHKGYVTGLAFSQDGSRLATSGEDETVRLWNLAGDAPAVVFKGHTYPVQGVAISPDGKLLASAAGDEDRPTKPGEVKLWDVATGKEAAALTDHKKGATGVAFSADGAFVASTGLDEVVNLHQTSDHKPLGYFNGHGRPTNAVAFAPDGKSVISVAGGRAKGNNTVMLWNREDGEEIAASDAHQGKVTSLALSTDGRTLVTGSYDKTVAVWDLSKFVSAGAGNAPVEPAVAEVSKAVDAKVVQVIQKVVAEAAQEAKDPAAEAKPLKELKAGIIGLDTSHATAFTAALNSADKKADLAGCRIVAAYPKGSPDIKSSTERVPGYIEQVKKHGVEIVDSIDDLLEKVDVVFLETNDGRPHLEQVIKVFKAKKPVFIDKPVAASLADAIAIYDLAKKYNVPCFSSSSLRYTEGAQALRKGSAGDILGCEAYSPCSLEATHPDLFWYGIHGVETLFTVMGTGCQSVTRVASPDTDYVTGTWTGGRVGTFRGIRKGAGGYGGTAYGTKAIVPVGSYGKDGPYRPMLVEILKFFQTGVVPVDPKETIEIYAFMEAADESKRQGGKPVTLESVMEKAKAEAAKRAAEVDR